MKKKLTKYIQRIKKLGPKKIFEKLVLGITYFYMILSPLYFNYNNIHMTYTPAVELLKKVWFIATLFIFIGNLVFSILEKRKPTFLEFLIILFPFLYLLPICLGKPTLSIEANIRYMVISILLSSHILALSRILTKKNLDSLLKFYVITTALSCILSLLVYSNPNISGITQIQMNFGDYYKSSVDRLYGTMLYPNAYAVFILIGYFINFYYLKEKKLYNYFLNFYYLIFFALTLSKITLLVFLIINLMIFIYHMVKKDFVFIKEYISVHVSMLIPLLFIIGETRSFIFNCNLFIYMVLMILAFIAHYLVYLFLNKISKKNIFYILSLFVLMIVTIVPTINYKSTNLVVDNIVRDNDFIFVDFQDFERNHKYKMTVKVKNDTIDNYARLELRYVYPRYAYIIKRKEKIEKTEVGLKEYVFEFETKNYFEFYYLKFTNITPDNRLEVYPVKVEDLETGEIKYYPVNTKYAPFIFVKSIEQIKYDKASLITRLDMYEETISNATSQAKENKNYFGKGIKAFANSTGFNDEHSFVARMLSEIGFIGVIHYLLLICVGLFYSFKILKNKENIVFILLFLLLIGGSLFDLNMNYEFLRFSLYLFLVMLKYQADNSKKKINPKS